MNVQIGDHQTHPYAEAWPLIEGREFQELVDNIVALGLLNDIWLWKHDDSILDGRNRYRACIAAGVKPRFKYYTGDDPLAFIDAQNEKRRHENFSVRCIVAAKLATLSRGRRSKIPGARDLSQAEAGKHAGVSTDSVQLTVAMRKTATPELEAAFMAEKLTLEAAADLAKRPKAEQLAKLAELEQEREAGAARRAGVRDIAHRDVKPANDEKTEAVDARVQLARVLKLALDKAGASTMLDPKGIHVAFGGKVFLVHVEQMRDKTDRGGRAA